MVMATLNLKSEKQWRKRVLNYQKYVPFLFLLCVPPDALGVVTYPPLITKQPPTDEILFQVVQRRGEIEKPFIIECEAEGFPEPKYTWIKNGKEFNWQTEDKRISVQQGRGTLVITSPSQTDTGQYQCFATNSFGTATSNSVFVRMAELNSFKDDHVITSVLAQEGQPFKLTCSPPDGFPKPRVDWMLQNQAGTLLNMNNSRMTVDPEGTLWFSSIELGDRTREFNYACSAYNVFRQEYKLGNRVFLQVSPTSSSSSSASANKVAPVLQYATKRNAVATKGGMLELWCIVGGAPLPEVRWSKKASSLPYDRLQYDKYGKVLKIEDVQLSDAGSYDCDASNGVGDPISYSITVAVQAAPYFKTEPDIINAAEGETVEFPCSADGVPSPRINWIFNGKPIEEADDNPRRVIMNDRIVLRKILETDTGNYGCNASNSLGYVYKDVYLNVLALPPEIRTPPSDKITISSTQNTTMTCRVFGAPKPRIEWIRGNTKLTGGRFRPLSNGDLEIKDVQFSDAGRYTCFASNKFGNDSRSAELVVKAPTIITSGPQNYQVRAGHSATFHCGATGDPTLPLTIDWLNDGVRIDFDLHPRYIKLSDNSLTIDRTSEIDSGQYTCLAYTDYDNATASASLIVQDVPNRPELLEVECRRRDANIRWRAMGDNRSPILHYTIQSNTSFNPDSWATASDLVPATDSSYTVSMSPWANYTFRVIAKNSIGPSPPSGNSQVCTTPADVPFSNPENLRTARTLPGTLRMVWSPMQEIEHNAPKFHYELQWLEDTQAPTSTSDWKSVLIHDWKTSEYVVHNVPIYKAYFMKIRAINSIGQSNVGPTIVRGWSGQDVPSAAPTNLTLHSKLDYRSALISWTPVHPNTLNGKFEGYKIETWTLDDPDNSRIITTKPEANTAVVETLRPFTKNYIRVYAFNTDHPGPSSRVLEVEMGEGPPGPVGGLEAKRLSSSSILVKWEKPEERNGILIGYNIEYVKVVGTEILMDTKEVRRPNISSPEILSAKLGGLEPGTMYRIYVIASTRYGPGENQSTFVQESTYPDTEFSHISRPSFTWSQIESDNGNGAIRVQWRPNLDGGNAGAIATPDGGAFGGNGGVRPGSAFFTQYRPLGATTWTQTPIVLHEDFEIVRGLMVGEVFIFRVVSVDGNKQAVSQEQEVQVVRDPPYITTHYAMPPPYPSSASWFIALIVTFAFLILVLILVCILKRNRGGKYAVYEREIRHGRLDFDNDGFKEYVKGQGPGSGQGPSGTGGHGQLLHGQSIEAQSDTDSMVEYGDDAGKFTEDGSFIGQYGIKGNKGQGQRLLPEGPVPVPINPRTSGGNFSNEPMGSPSRSSGGGTATFV